jgi:hypothetical protein
MYKYLLLIKPVLSKLNHREHRENINEKFGIQDLPKIKDK